MALFPKCTFNVLLPDGVLTSGSRVDGVLEVSAPEPIPRAEHVYLYFRSNAWVGYGGGKSREVVRRDMLISSLHVDLPVGQAFPQGTLRYPFQIDVPAWVSPSFVGNDCAIENVIEARLDVDWAKDPVSYMRPVVVVPPVAGLQSPLVMRTPAGFHESIVIELTLQSSAVVHGQPFLGRIALRGGHTARFDAIVVALTSGAFARMGRGDLRSWVGNKVRIEAEHLRRGEAVPFVLPLPAGVPHTFANGFLDHVVFLDVSVDIPWAHDPSIRVPVTVLPHGSTLHATASEIAVGAERVQLLSASMARATGLPPGRLPVLVEGRIANVGVRLTDSPRHGRLGVDLDLVFPDTELGAMFRPLGMLEGFRDSPLLPQPLRRGHLLRFEPRDARPSLGDGPLSTFTEIALRGLERAEEVRFSDHHLGAHFSLTDDGSEPFDALARFACEKAKSIADAIAALPFPAAAEAHRSAWQAAAREQNAVLVPTGPSIQGLSFRSRVLGGEERVATASVRTAWRKDGPTSVVDVDLQAMPLPADAWSTIADGKSEQLRAVRGVFPEVHRVPGGEHAILERPGFTADPRDLLAGIEMFVAWALEMRGERRAIAPYR